MCARTATTTVSDLIAERHDLTTFNNFIRRTRVVAELEKDGPFTVFAPTNAAFERLPAGALGGLTDDMHKLHEVMAYHVVDGLYLVASLIEPEQVPTLADRALTLSPAEGGMIAGSALVVDPDITADNGVLHVIDTVLMPD